MKKWLFNKVVLNPMSGFYLGIPACILSGVGYYVIGGVMGVIMVGCLALQLFGFKPIE